MERESESPRKLFISYRRSDSQHVTERLADHLSTEFGSQNVFVDTEDIPFGSEFENRIKDAIKEATVVLPVIGNRWLEPTAADGTCKLFESADFVRRELEWAQEFDVNVLPVLLDGTKMPKKSELPKSIQFLTDVNAVPIRSGNDFRFTLHRLIVYLQDTHGFPRKDSAKSLISTIWSVGLGATIFGGFASAGLVVTTVMGGLLPISPDDMLLQTIVGEALGPILLGCGILAMAYSQHKSCVLRAMERRPSYLGLASAQKQKHIFC